MKSPVGGVKLARTLQDASAVPYFMWDEPMTLADLRQRLASGPPAERLRLLGKILREARDPDVWAFTSRQEVLALWPALRVHLGRRRPFWEFLLDRWREIDRRDRA
jgi:hypothetical protein